VRFDKARQLLTQSALSTSDIALLLGFSELSAFSRAFKRWSGMSPKHYRENITA
jgi:AraC-like DNA-binding protein